MASKDFLKHWDIDEKISSGLLFKNVDAIVKNVNIKNINDIKEIQKIDQQNFMDLVINIAEVSPHPVSYLLCNRASPYSDLAFIQSSYSQKETRSTKVLNKLVGFLTGPSSLTNYQTTILSWLLRLRQAGIFEDFSYPEPQNQHQRDFAFAAEWLYIEHQFNPDKQEIDKLPKKNQIQRKLAQIRLCAQCVKWWKKNPTGIPSIHMILLKHSKWRNGEMTREIMNQMFNKDIWDYSAFPYKEKFTDDQIAKISADGLTNDSFWNLPILKTQFDLGALTQDQKDNIKKTFKLRPLLNSENNTLKFNHKLYLLMSWCYLIWKPREVKNIDDVASTSTWRDYFNFW